MSKHDLPSPLHLLQCVVDYKWLVIILTSYTAIAATTLAVFMMLQCFFVSHCNGVCYPFQLLGPLYDTFRKVTSPKFCIFLVIFSCFYVVQPLLFGIWSFKCADTMVLMARDFDWAVIVCPKHMLFLHMCCLSCVVHG